MQRVYEIIARAAATTATVLIRGESGTGKELAARAIHVNSQRTRDAFVKIDCTSIPEGLMESELFGHERGAFTGALSRHLGRFEIADGGTIFLDEIGDLPMEVQVKLLRVLQERSFERVGGHETIRVDVRVISATHRNLEALVEQGKFREDLYYRLNVFPITLPPLRERLSDVPALVHHFMQKWRQHSPHLEVGGPGRGPAIDETALQLLMQYSFPGNVRELENLIGRALILATGPLITVADLEFGRPTARRPPAGAPAPLPAPPVTGATHLFPPELAELPALTPLPGGARSLADRLSDQERAEIISAIEQKEGNIAAAARALGINRSTLYYRLRKHDLLHLLPSKPEAEAASAG